MTDKQIKEVFKNGFYCIEPCPEIKELQAELKAKEQECEELKEAQKNSRCAWKSLEGTFCPEAQEQLDQLNAKLSKLKSRILCENEDDLLYELMQIIEE